MAQHLRPGRADNRGGHKPKKSTKKLFIYRVERSKHEELKAYAIKLNQEAEDDRTGRYTLLMMHHFADFSYSKWFDMQLNLSLSEAKTERDLRDKETNTSSDGNFTEYKVVKIEDALCNTTEN